MDQLRVGRLSIGFGLILGGIEYARTTFSIPLSLSIGELLVLAAVSLLLNGLMAWVLGLLCGFFVSLIGPSDHYVDKESKGLSLCMLLLSAWIILPLALRVYEQGRVVPAVLFCFFPILFSTMTWYNVRFWLKKEFHENGSDHSWMKVSSTLSLILIVMGVFWGGNKEYGSSNAISTDPDIFLITVDTLRRDHLSAYYANPEDAPVQTPELDALAKEGLLYWDAVTPMPETLPAHAAIMTGRYPAHADVLSNGHPLPKGKYTTIAEYLEREGYSTAAFVSSFALDSRGGLDRGFQLYDDQFIPGLPGASEFQLIHYSLRGLMRYGSPAWFPWLLERSADRTIENAEEWMNTYTERPAFVWLHLFEPHAPYEPHGLAGFEANGSSESPVVDHRDILEMEKEVEYTDELQEQLRNLYREEVAYIDMKIGAFVKQVRNRDVERDALIVITADHGEMLGEHGVMFHHLSLYEESIQVPLIVLPIRGETRSGVVKEPVRLMDLYNTIISQAGFPFINNTHSMDIVSFLEDESFLGYGIFLMGRNHAAVERGNLFGYRTQAENTGSLYKYIYEQEESQHWLYNLSKDPDEENNVSEVQQEIYLQLKEITLQSMADVPTIAPAVGATELEALRALGYVE